MVLFIKNILCMYIQEILIIAVQCNCTWVPWAHISKSGWKLGLESTLWFQLRGKETKEELGKESRKEVLSRQSAWFISQDNLLSIQMWESEKAARCLGRNRSQRLWMHGDLQVSPSQCWEDVTMQIFDILLHSQWCSLSLNCVIAGGSGVWAFPKPQFLQRTSQMDYNASTHLYEHWFLSTSGIFRPNKLQQRNNKWWIWFDFQADSFFKSWR